jgi:hypothetical protein
VSRIIFLHYYLHYLIFGLIVIGRREVLDSAFARTPAFAYRFVGKGVWGLFGLFRCPQEARRFKVHMRAEQSGGRANDGTCEVTIRIENRDGCGHIVVEERSEPEATRTVAIPVGLLPELKRAIEKVESSQSSGSGSTVSFAHASEEEFARILDFYRIAWEYEPVTFPLECDRSGKVSSSFTPDFYLPEHDLFIEITTLRQALVTRKNRKLRRMRELYPEVNIKMLYASDYRKIVEKFVASGELNGRSKAGVNTRAKLSRNK